MPKPLVRLLAAALHVLSAIATILLMMLIVVDVFLRYVFSNPIFGSDEMTTYLFSIIVVAGLGVVTQERSHIVVSLFEEWLQKHARNLPKRVFDSVSLLGMAFVSFVLARHALNLMVIDQRSMVLKLPIGVIALFLAVIAVIGTLLGLAVLFKSRAESVPKS